MNALSKRLTLLLPFILGLWLLPLSLQGMLRQVPGLLGPAKSWGKMVDQFSRRSFSTIEKPVSRWQSEKLQYYTKYVNPRFIESNLVHVPGKSNIVHVPGMETRVEKFQLGKPADEQPPTTGPRTRVKKHERPIYRRPQGGTDAPSGPFYLGPPESASLADSFYMTPSPA
ncbi:MAG: hypothetical protein WBQ73_02630, partial [Candidatus Babeliales bacterium]